MYTYTNTTIYNYAYAALPTTVGGVPTYERTYFPPRRRRRRRPRPRLRRSDVTFWSEVNWG